MDSKELQQTPIDSVILFSAELLQVRWVRSVLGPQGTQVSSGPDAGNSNRSSTATPLNTLSIYRQRISVSSKRVRTVGETEKLPVLGAANGPPQGSGGLML